MTTPVSMTSMDFENALTPGVVRAMRWIHASLMLGPCVYALGVGGLFLSERDAAPVRSAFGGMDELSLVHAAFTAGAFVLGLVLFRSLFHPGRLGAVSGQEAGERCVGLFRTASIARLAVLEGAAFFGLSVCVIGATNGALQAEPMYWLNLGSTVLLLASGTLTFPTREGLLRTFRLYFGVP